MKPSPPRRRKPAATPRPPDAGQASLLLLAALLAGTLILFGFGQAVGRGEHQRAADLAANIG